MNENLNLCKILAGCLKGTPLYSMAHGEVKLNEVANEMISVYFGEGSTIVYFSNNGHLGNNTDGECLLWPSKDCRDWSQFNQSQQTQFSNGDHILWRNNDGNEFFGVFDRYTEDGQGVVVLLRGETISDWDVYIKDLTKLEKFDPKMLKTGDAVLVRDGNIGEWTYTNFSHLIKHAGERIFCASCCVWRQCVPYNIETKDLIGTCDGAPKFYVLTEN